MIRNICLLCLGTKKAWVLGPALRPLGPLALSLSWILNRASSGPCVLSILARASHMAGGSVLSCCLLPGPSVVDLSVSPPSLFPEASGP